MIRSAFAFGGAASASVALAAIAAPGCLPDDNRPEPASIFVTAEPTASTREGFTTADGWSVTFERFLTGLGDVDLDDPSREEEAVCAAYSDARYQRLYDFTTVTQEKVGLLYGLGTCSVEYRHRGPTEDTVLGSGASEDDADLMRQRESDGYAEDERATLIVRGVAEKDGDQKRFQWTFRRSFEVDQCTASSSDDAVISILELEGGQEHALRIEVRGEELFRSGANDQAPLEFERFAAADADGDGDVTFEELEAVEPPPLDAWPVELGGNPDEEGPGDEDEEEEPTTLGAYVYQRQLPRVTRLAGGGACRTDVR